MDKLNNYITPRRVILVVIILAIIMSSIIPVARFVLKKPLIAGETPYYDIRISKEIIKKGLIFDDNLVLDGRNYIAKPYHTLLAFLSTFLNLELYLNIIPFIAGIISALLFYLLLKEVDITLKQRLFVFAILLLSPAYIFAFGTPNEFCISIMLIFLGTYLFLRTDKFFWPCALFSISVIFSILNSIVIILLMLFFSEISEDKKKLSNRAILFTVILTLLFYTPTILSINLFSRNIIQEKAFMSLISDLGGTIGLSVFAFILGLIGLILTWDYKKKLKNIYFLTVLLMFIGLYYSYANIYLSFIFSIFAGIALARITAKKWDNWYLKFFMISLILTGILFSSISYINRTIYSDPSKDIKDSMLWLENNSDKNDIVFSHYKNGLWIEYWAERPVVIDGISNFEMSKQILNDSDVILNSRHLDETKNLLDKYQINYIFITPDMKDENSILSRSGLLYLFGNRDTFAKLYDKKEVEIWEYLPAKNQ